MTSTEFMQPTDVLYSMYEKYPESSQFAIKLFNDFIHMNEDNYKSRIDQMDDFFKDRINTRTTPFERAKANNERIVVFTALANTLKWTSPKLFDLVNNYCPLKPEDPIYRSYTYVGRFYDLSLPMDNGFNKVINDLGIAIQCDDIEEFKSILGFAVEYRDILYNDFFISKSLAFAIRKQANKCANYIFHFMECSFDRPDLTSTSIDAAIITYNDKMFHELCLRSEFTHYNLETAMYNCRWDIAEYIIQHISDEELNKTNFNDYFNDLFHVFCTFV